MTQDQVLAMVERTKAKMVDFKFVDFPGIWQHFTVPVRELDEDAFENTVATFQVP